jgi:hypothetical protein
MEFGTGRGIGILLTGLAAAGLLATAGAADVLETRDGRILQGTYLGGTQQSVRFESGGEVQVLSRDQILALTFVPGSAGQAPSAAANPPPVPGSTPSAGSPSQTAAATPPPVPPKPSSTLVRIPAGTRLQVRLRDPIDTRLAAVNDVFHASLESGLGLDGKVIVPTQTPVSGRVSEVQEGGGGGGPLKLELTQLLLQGHQIGLVTGSQSVSPPASPAGDPAAAPGGIQPGTLLEFRLLQPVDLRIQ